MNHLINEEAWQRMWQSLGVVMPASHFFVEFQARYTEPHRAYHTLHHIANCLAHFASAIDLAEAPTVVEAAIWFHDVIYEPKRNDNEVASAAWAATLLQDSDVVPETIATISELIKVTAHDRPPSTADEALLLDIDLAILGAATIPFDEYEQQIRAEYNWVPWPTYCQRRVVILQRFLNRPAIYQTNRFQERFESAARQNIERSIQRLADTNEP